MGEIGFERAELNSESLAGSVKEYDTHVFLAWGLATDWPEDPFDAQHDGTLPVQLNKAIKAAKAEIKSKVRLTLVEATTAAEAGYLFVFPQYVQYSIGADGAGIEEFVRSLAGGSLQDLSGKPGSGVRDIEDPFVFVCAHEKRDARCGHCGPRLLEFAAKMTQSGRVPSMQLRKCSHVGGHKYAGNVIIYSGKGAAEDGHWYGYATPKNLQLILTGRAIRSNLWRGRLGISESMAVAERKRQVLLSLLPLALVAAAISVGCVAWLRRRKT